MVKFTPNRILWTLCTSSLQIDYHTGIDLYDSVQNGNRPLKGPFIEPITKDRLGINLIKLYIFQNVKISIFIIQLVHKQ